MPDRALVLLGMTDDVAVRAPGRELLDGEGREHDRPPRSQAPPGAGELDQRATPVRVVGGARPFELGVVVGPHDDALVGLARDLSEHVRRVFST